MSVAEGYSIHVYCDHPDHMQYCASGQFGEFIGNNQKEAWKNFRRAGWKRTKALAGPSCIVPNTVGTICPKCVARTS